MSIRDYSPTPPTVSTANLSPASQLIIQARELERKASDLFGQARREAATGNPEPSVRSNSRALDLLKQADELLKQAKRISRPSRTAGWFHADWFGSHIVVTNVDARWTGSMARGSLVAYIECDPADMDKAEIADAGRYLVASMNADLTTADWLRMQDIEVTGLTSIAIPDGYCLTIGIEGELAESREGVRSW